MTKASSRNQTALTIAAIGVVFGDIGTSPLYVVRECFRKLAPTEAHILGVASLIFWSLTILVSIKYVTFLLRATSHGEGGIFALFALCRKDHRAKSWLFATGAIGGAALLFSDGMITPAISVLSAVEGLELLSPKWESVVVPLTIGILAGLFLLQPLGAGRLGRGFGLVMIPWFLAIGAIGFLQILQAPEILRGLNPVHGIRLLTAGHIGALAVLGGVLLCITGAEALFADIGHFGKRAIRIGWWGLVKPCLLASYFGQLAWMLHHGSSSASNPFFAIVPANIQPGLVLLATAATVIASQALISGVFSLTEQGIRLGFLPRLHVVHTSSSERGQVYLPRINWLLMAACISLVLLFRASDRLASAYGLAVVTGMAISSLFFLYHVWRNQNWPILAAFGLTGIWLLVELTFLISASEKFLSGAWLPALFTVILSSIMHTWRWGNRRLRKIDAAGGHTPLKEFITEHEGIPRLPGTSGVILSGESLEPELAAYVECLGMLPQHLLLLTIDWVADAKVPEGERFHLHEEEADIHSLHLRVGFAERPDIASAVRWAATRGSGLDTEKATYYVFRRSLIAAKSQSDALFSFWRRSLFAMLYQQSAPAWRFFALPADQVVEISVHEPF